MSTTARKLPVQVASILDAVAKETGVLPDTFIGCTYRQPVAYIARNLAIVLVHVTTNLTLMQIGRIFEVHFSTVLYTVRAFTLSLPGDQRLAERYTALLLGRSVLRPLGVQDLSAPKPTPEEAQAERQRTIILQGDIVSPATHGHLHELHEPAVRTKLKEAEEQLTYWTGCKARAFTESARNEAAARVTLWEIEVRAIKGRLDLLTHAAA